MAHREVYGLLHGVLMVKGQGRFVLTDLACGKWAESCPSAFGTNA
ncbi:MULTISPECIES: hypothetical protein [unclassified Mesorhizobium]